VPVHGGLMAVAAKRLAERRAGAVVHGSSPWRHGEQEEDEGVLTSGDIGRQGD
jgi:hypothetical protein